MTLPTFVVAGAAKSGTSALARLLGQHPEIFMASHKESHHFLTGEQPLRFEGPGDDDLNAKIVHRPADYERLFEGAGGATAIGEASVFYVTDPACFERMADRLDDPRVIISLRDPVDRAFSAYSHMRLDGREELGFGEALAAEPDRAARGWEPIWRYRGLGHYTGQLDGVYAHLPADRVHLVRYDELRADPLRVTAGIHEFLGVAPFEPDTSVRVNVSGRPRSRRLHELLHTRSPLRSVASAVVPKAARHRIYRWLRNANVTAAERDDVSLRELAEHYRDEIAVLEQRTGWDLSTWGTAGSSRAAHA